MPFPWNVLGLNGPASEADIRRAYAKQLRTLKFEEDDQAFQNLIAARSRALALAIDRKAEHVSEVAETTIPEIVRTTPHDSHVSCMNGTHPHLHSEHVPEESGNALHTFDEVSDAGASYSGERTDGPSSCDLEILATRLKAVSAEGWHSNHAKEWIDILRELALLPLGQAKRLEPDVIQSMSTLMRTPEILGPVPWWKRWRRINRFRRSHRYVDARYLAIILEAASLYGWFRRDSAIWQNLDHIQAESMFLHLHAARRAQEVLESESAHLKGRKGSRAFSARDLAAILDRNSASTVQIIHQRYILTGHWPRMWSLRAFVLAPFIAIHVRLKRLLCLWAILLIYVPWKTSTLAYPYDKIFLLLSLSGVLCIHVWISAYWYRGHIFHANRLVAKADRLRIFQPDLRWTFLIGKSPDRFGKPRNQWNIGQRIWFCALCFVSICMVASLLQRLGIAFY